MRRLCVFSVGAVLVSWGLLFAASPAGAAGHPRTKSLVPIVRSIVPDHGPQSGGTSVLLRGSNIVNATAVDFGGTPASTFTIRSQNSLMVTSPPGTGTVDVTVTTPDGTSGIASADQFSYATTPTIQSVTPRSGATLGGTTVTISGSGFTGATGIDFGTAAAASFVVDSNIAITAVSPAEAAGQVDVSVTGPDGTSPIDPADEFTYTLRVPTVTGVTPASGPPGGGTQVVITGTQFLHNGTSVFFGGTPAESFSVLDSRAIMAFSPAGTGVVDVTVSDKYGTSATSTADQFTYVSNQSSRLRSVQAHALRA